VAEPAPHGARPGGHGQVRAAAGAPRRALRLRRPRARHAAWAAASDPSTARGRRVSHTRRTHTWETASGEQLRAYDELESSGWPRLRCVTSAR